jgi:hypothetical protein
MQSGNSKLSSKEGEKNFYEHSLKNSKRESVDMVSNSMHCESRRKNMVHIPGNVRLASVLNQSNIADKSENIGNSSNDSDETPLEALLELKAPKGS